METIDMYVTDPHRVAFVANGGFPVYSATPENVYRLILSEDEEDIILQGRSDRKIVPAEAKGNWVPRNKGGYRNTQLDQVNAQRGQELADSMRLPRWWESSTKVHRSKERGWEEITRWSADEHESVLRNARVVIVEDQAKLNKAQEEETRRQGKIRRIIDSLTAEPSRV